MIYLDSAATTLQKPPEVAQAVGRAVNLLASPGRGGHRPSVWAGETAYRCREAAAELFHLSDPEQVAFTINATHGLNIAIRTLVNPGDKVVISAWEHNSVTRTLQSIPNVQIVIARAPLFDIAGTVSAFSSAITEDVKAVVFTHISNVFGFILPVEEIASICRRRGIPYILDASQSAGCEPVDGQALGAHFIAMPGHKGLFGPQGTGLLLCNQMPNPLLTGGTGSDSRRQQMPDFMPDCLEAGTHNMPGIAGLLEGIQFVQKLGTSEIRKRESHLIQHLAIHLRTFPQVQYYHATDASCQGGVISFRIPGLDCEELGERLGARGICVRSGLHCAPLAHESAGTLESGTVRISVTPFNTIQELDRFSDILKETIA